MHGLFLRVYNLVGKVDNTLTGTKHKIIIIVLLWGGTNDISMQKRFQPD